MFLKCPRRGRVALLPLILAVEMQEVSCPYFFQSYSVLTDSGGPGDPAKTAELRSTMTKFKEISQ